MAYNPYMPYRVISHIEALIIWLNAFIWLITLKGLKPYKGHLGHKV